MKNNKFSKIKVFNGLKGFVLGFVLAASLVAGAVYAWNAVWHGTDWIQAGRVVESEKIAENFEYLNKKISDLREFVTTLSNEDSITHINDIGYVNINGETNLGDDWTWIILEGTAISGDAAAAGGHIVKLQNGQVKVAISSVTGGRKVFIANNAYNCLWDNDSWYRFCVKYDGNLFIKTGGATSLNYVKIR